MNLLLVNHYAGTPALGMEYRPYYLAREWVRLGHRVMIVAATYSHVRTRQPEAAEAERQAARARIELAAAVSAWRQALGLLPQ